MKHVCLLATYLLAYQLFAQNGLECVVVEKYYVSDANDTTVNADGGALPVGSVTYRIYADMLPGYKFQAAYGVDVAPIDDNGPGDHELRLETTTYFFNNEDRGATTPTYTKTHCKSNTVMLDSWLSVGAACAGHYGIMKSLDNGVSTVVNDDGVLQNNDPSAGIPLTDQDGLIAGSPQPVTEVGITNLITMFDNQNDGTNGPLFSTWNGSWACLGGCMGPDTTDNKVLIAQMTTNGTFMFELNIQIGTPSGGVERYVARNPVGAEIQLPCLIDTFWNIPTVPNVAPTVSITSPTNNATFTIGQSVSISATAADSDGSIAQVEFFVDGNSVGTSASSPYSTNWTATVGAHSLTAVATDNLGAQSTSAPVSITVNDTSSVSVTEIYFGTRTVTLAPQPASGAVTLTVNGCIPGRELHCKLLDLTGRSMAEFSYTPVSNKMKEVLPLHSMAAGQYMIRIQQDGISSTHRLLKQ